MSKLKADPSRQSLEDIERARLNQERVQVLAQPHRCGDDSDMTDPLGMFVRIHQCGRECYEAGNEYFRLVYRWRRARGIPNPVRLVETENSSGGDLDDGTVDDWEKKIKRCEDAMKCSGLPGFRAAQKLVLDGEYPADTWMPAVAGPIKRAIHSLAIELGRFPY